MSAPLSNLQKRDLSKLASRAFARECAIARGRGETPDSTTKATDAFRHGQVALATGKNGLRCCSQDDYKIVEAHFLNLLGETGRAMNALAQHQSNTRRVAEYKLTQACREAGVNIGYAAAICQRVFKCCLDDASAEVIWKVMFTVKNRARKVSFANSQPGGSR